MINPQNLGLATPKNTIIETRNKNINCQEFKLSKRHNYNLLDEIIEFENEIEIYHTEKIIVKDI